jgi:hypothetical protein
MPAIRFMICSSLTLAACALVAVADEDCHCENGYYEKVVTAYKKVCHEEKVPQVVRKPYIRYENKPCPQTVMVKKEFVVKRPQTIQEEQVVTKCRKVPVKLVDPDTGCSIITYKNEYFPAKIMVPKTIMVDVRVLRDVPEERMIMAPCPVQDFRDVTVFVSKQVCETVPYQKRIRIPCPPPGPNYRVEVPVDPRAPMPTREPEGF